MDTDNFTLPQVSPEALPSQKIISSHDKNFAMINPNKSKPHLQHAPTILNKEILLIDKPDNMSSFGVVARVRRKFSEHAGHKVKVGHTGTLDPFATGLLVLLIGKGTKRANEFLKLDKEYIATIHLGATSTTGDPEGEITPQPVTNIPNLDTVTSVINSFVGKIEQTIPQFSAVKINGQRAYKLARAGKPVEMPRRTVTVYELEILDYSWPELKIRCKVSSGTYIRTLGEDIGNKLVTGAYLTNLRRTKVGNFRIEEATKLDDFYELSLALNSTTQ